MPLTKMLCTAYHILRIFACVQPVFAAKKINNTGLLYFKKSLISQHFKVSGFKKRDLSKCQGRKIPPTLVQMLRALLHDLRRVVQSLQQLQRQLLHYVDAVVDVLLR